jgi:hypothetical protein
MTMAENEVDTKTAGTTAVEVRGLRKVYDAEGAPVRALRGADLTMSPASSWP